METRNGGEKKKARYVALYNELMPMTANSSIDVTYVRLIFKMGVYFTKNMWLTINTGKGYDAKE